MLLSLNFSTLFNFTHLFRLSPSLFYLLPFYSFLSIFSYFRPFAIFSTMGPVTPYSLANPPCPVASLKSIHRRPWTATPTFAAHSFTGTPFRPPVLFSSLVWEKLESSKSTFVFLYFNYFRLWTFDFCL